MVNLNKGGKKEKIVSYCGNDWGESRVPQAAGSRDQQDCEQEGKSDRGWIHVQPAKVQEHDDCYDDSR
jgi:hypothetical protein